MVKRKKLDVAKLKRELGEYIKDLHETDEMEMREVAEELDSMMFSLVPGWVSKIPVDDDGEMTETSSS